MKITFLLVLLLSCPALAQPPPCPKVSLRGPDRIMSPTQDWIFRAHVEGAVSNSDPVYQWTAHNAEILAGQGTAKVKVHPRDHRGITTVSVKVGSGHFPPGCNLLLASESSVSDRAPRPEPISILIGSVDKVNDAEFAMLVRESSRDLTANVYFLVSGGRGGTVDAKVAVLKARLWSAIDGKRMIFSTTRRQNDVVEVWLVPAGSFPPTY